MLSHARDDTPKGRNFDKQERLEGVSVRHTTHCILLFCPERRGEGKAYVTPSGLHNNYTGSGTATCTTQIER